VLLLLVLHQHEENYVGGGSACLSCSPCHSCSGLLIRAGVSVCDVVVVVAAAVVAATSGSDSVLCASKVLT